MLVPTCHDNHGDLDPPSQNVTFVACSGFTGDNLTEPYDAAGFEWYKGPTLLHAIGERRVLIESGVPTCLAHRYLPHRLVSARGSGPGRAVAAVHLRCLQGLEDLLQSHTQPPTCSLCGPWTEHGLGNWAERQVDVRDAAGTILCRAPPKRLVDDLIVAVRPRTHRLATACLFGHPM